MAKLQGNTGSYVSKKSGLEVQYDYEYQVVASIADATATLGEDKVLSLVQRMLKVDANNLAREKAKVVNGDSLRKPMTEAEKASKKAERQANKQLLEILKSKGLTLDDIKNL